MALVNQKDMSSITIALAMMFAAVMAYTAKPTEYLANVSPRNSLSDEFPRKLSHWNRIAQGGIQLVNPERDSIRNYLYTEELGLSFVNGARERIMLSLAYGKDQSDGRSVHKPTICYPAQGFEILEQRDLKVKLDRSRTIIAHYMKTKNGRRVEPLLFWTTAGDYLYQTKIQKKIIGLQYSTKNLIPDGMVVRVSTLEDDADVAIDLLKDFIHDWYTSIPESERSRYFGTVEP